MAIPSPLIATSAAGKRLCSLQQPRFHSLGLRKSIRITAVCYDNDDNNVTDLDEINTIKLNFE